MQHGLSNLPWVSGPQQQGHHQGTRLPGKVPWVMHLQRLILVAATDFVAEHACMHAGELHFIRQYLGSHSPP
jgi:hypothetical protein